LVHTVAVAELISSITTGRDGQRAGPVYPVGSGRADRNLSGHAETVLVFETRWALRSLGMDTHSILEDRVLGTDVFLIQHTPGPVIHGPLWAALHVGFACGRVTPGGGHNVVEGNWAGGIVKDIIRSRHLMGGNLKGSTSQQKCQGELHWESSCSGS
jgi:hypothetical protein